MFQTTPTFTVSVVSDSLSHEEKTLREREITGDEPRSLSPSDVSAPDEAEHLLRACGLEEVPGERAQERAAKRVRAYEALVAESDPVFAEIEDVVGTLVRRGQLERTEVPRPRRPETLDRRCKRIEALVDLLEDHEEGVFVLTSEVFESVSRSVRDGDHRGARPVRMSEMAITT